MELVDGRSADYDRRDSFVLENGIEECKEKRVTLFTKIINREIPATIVYEDDRCLAFRDINPQAPVHILLIPKKEIPTLNDLQETDRDLLGHLILKAADIAKSEGIAERGYRLVLNTNSHAGQTVNHIHFHIIGGRAMSWPPG